MDTTDTRSTPGKAGEAMTFGEKLAALMAERGIGLRQLARLVPCDHGHLSKLRSGDKTPSAKLADRLDELLCADGALAGLRPSAPTHRTLHNGPLFDREGLVLLAPPTERGRLADADYVQTLREDNQRLISMDSLHGGNDVLPLSLRIFRSAHAKLAAGSHERTVQRDLEAAAGETAEIASWIAYDADKQEIARQIIHEALFLSRLAGDRSMEQFELSHLALLALHERRSREALRICEAVQDDPRMPPRVGALFDLRRARALAQMNDCAAAFRALEQAAATIGESITERDPSWTWWLDDAELAWHRGMLHIELDEWGRAVDCMAASARTRTNARRLASTRTRARYNDLAHLLEALVHVQQWNAAESVIADVLDQAAEVGSARTAKLLRGVVAQVARDRAPSTVADASEDLRQLLAVVDPA
ncbi:helix-turn-helix transcriptional regulator [Actinomadura fulvescens]|uniref:HTH cro/C1-type domain-containing protein n=1 Tax=Actinomadura fulvescens TaxID=46160 RepID=A0ABN3QV95_9ACTN